MYKAMLKVMNLGFWCVVYFLVFLINMCSFVDIFLNMIYM